MQNHPVRDHLIVDIHKGKDTVVSHLCAAVDIGYLQIAVLPNGSLAAQHAVIPGRAAADAACHTAAPAKAGILLHAAAHQCQDLLCRAKVDELRRSQTQQLHPVRTKHLPHLFPRFCQLLTEFPFRLFQIKLLQRRILRQRIEKIRIQGQTHRPVDIPGHTLPLSRSGNTVNPSWRC